MSGTATAQLVTLRTPAGADRRTWLVMFSGSPLAAAAHRQQALTNELAGSYRVLYVDPPRNGGSLRFRVRQVADSLWHATVPAPLPGYRQLPLVNRIGRELAARLLRDWLDARPGPRLLWLDEDLAAPVAGRLGEQAVVYDCTDLDWTFTRSWNRWHLRGSLHRALGAADLITISSAALRHWLPPTAGRPVLVANACDPAHFHPDGPVSGWIAELPGPRIGYLGAVDTRALDGELVAALARRHPEWTFVLAGPITRAGRLPVAGLANVHLAGPVSYEDAPSLVRGFDVGLIPYRLDGRVGYVHPKKCYEYLAAGVPVVATRLPALLALDSSIRLATAPQDFGEAITAALDEARNPAAANRWRAVALANTWQTRGVHFRALLADLPGGAVVPSGAAGRAKAGAP